MGYNVTRKFTADQYAVYKWLGCKYCPSLKMRRAFFYKGAENGKEIDAP